MSEEPAPYGLRLKSYDIVERAVDEGIELGYRRAHKHTDRPSEDGLKEAIHLAIMNALDGVLIFSELE